MKKDCEQCGFCRKPRYLGLGRTKKWKNLIPSSFLQGAMTAAQSCRRGTAAASPLQPTATSPRSSLLPRRFQKPVPSSSSKRTTTTSSSSRYSNSTSSISSLNTKRRSLLKGRRCHLVATTWRSARVRSGGGNRSIAADVVPRGRRLAMHLPWLLDQVRFPRRPSSSQTEPGGVLSRAYIARREGALNSGCRRPTMPVRYLR